MLPGEVRVFLERVRDGAEVRRSGVGGTAAARNAYQALAFLYRHAVERGVVDERRSPLRLVASPRKLPSRHHALGPELIAEILRVARKTGLDPALDVLLLRFHLETAARVGGALALRVCDLDPGQSLVQLWEKGGTRRWQPVSPTLMMHLLHHARDRGARRDGDRVFRRLDRAVVSSWRYAALWRRVGRYVKSVRVLNVSTHWLRHTTVTWVERNFGYAVARAFAGHVAAQSSLYGSTQAYVKAGIEEVAAAVQALTGEGHPSAPASSAVVGGMSCTAGLQRMLGGAAGRVTLSEWLCAGDGVDVESESLVERVRGLYEEAERAGRGRTVLRWWR